jgi:hypothetical protein
MKEAFNDIAEFRFDEKDSILYIKMKEGAEMNLENTREHYALISRITGGKRYAAFVDCTNQYSIAPAVLKFSALPATIGNRVATVHFNPALANRMATNFFKSIHRPHIPIRVFTDREAAIAWLKSCLQK